MPMQIILSCFVSHTSSLVIFHLRIPGTNDTGCLPLRNSRKILILEFIISSVPCFTDREYLNFILIIFNINFYINTDYITMRYSLHMITKFHTYCTSIYINANCSMMNSILSGDMKLVWQADKIKSILNTAFRKKLMRYVLWPCKMSSLVGCNIFYPTDRWPWNSWEVYDENMFLILFIRGFPSYTANQLYILLLLHRFMLP